MRLPDGRSVLPDGTTVTLDGNEYRILGLIGYGGGSIIYDVETIRAKSRFALKEIFPASHCRRDNLQIVAIAKTGSTSLDMLKRSAENEIQVGHRAEQTNYQLCASWTCYKQADITLPNTSITQNVNNTYALGRNLHRQGCSLFQYMQNHGSFTLSQVIDIMESVCNAYAQLHDDHVLHGDVSLGNIFWLQHNRERNSCSGQAAIIDFGQARGLDDLWKSESIPADCPIPSTRGFTPPEALARKSEISMTPAADVYGLTILFYLLLTGEQPGCFIRLSTSTKNQDRLGCNSVMIDAVNDVLNRGTRYAPKDRYQNAGELLAELQQLKSACELRCSENGSVNLTTLRNAMMDYLKKHESFFHTEHDPKLAPELKALGVTKLTIYGRVEGSDEVRPIEDILEESQDNIYIEGAGGSGKTFALSRLLRNNIRNPAVVPLYLDMADFNEMAFRVVQNNHERVIPYLLAQRYMASNYADKSIDGIKHLLYDVQDCPILLVLDNLHKVPTELKSQALSAINKLQVRLVVAGREAKPASENGNQLLIHNHVTLCALPEEELHRILNLCKPLGTYEYFGWHPEDRCELLALPMFFMKYLELTVSKRNEKGYTLDQATTAEIFYDYFNALLLSSEARPLDYCQLLYDVIPRLAYRKLTNLDYSDALRILCANYKTQLDELGILTQANDQCVFEHDLYECYFASFYIAKQLHKALAGDISGLKSINNEWHYELRDYWPALLDLLLKGQSPDYKELCRMLEQQKCFLALGGVAIAWSDKWNRDHWPQVGIFSGSSFDQGIIESLEKAAKNGNRDAVLHLALIAQGSLDHKKEIRWFKQMWKCGSLVAATNIANAYRYMSGEASKKSLHWRYNRQRLRWLKKGAAADSPFAMDDLGDYYREKGDDQKARLWYRNAHIKGAEMGIARYLFELGRNYLVGDLVGKDATKAIQCFQKVIAQKDHFHSVLCWLYLGNIYSSSEKKDDAKAFFCYKQAASKEDPVASNKVGIAYFYGIGIQRNEQDAVHWFRKGMDGEIGCGCGSNLAYCYAHGIGVDQSFSAALECYTPAAELSGEWPALVALAKAYAFGWGYDRDIGKAIDYLEEAANQKIAIAQRALAYIHAYVNDDLEAAQFFYSCPLKPQHDEPDNTFIEKDALEPDVDEFIEWLLGLGITLNTEQILEKARAMGVEDIDRLAAKLQSMQE